MTEICFLEFKELEIHIFEIKGQNAEQIYGGQIAIYFTKNS